MISSKTPMEARYAECLSVSRLKKKSVLLENLKIFVSQ